MAQLPSTQPLLSSETPSYGSAVASKDQTDKFSPEATASLFSQVTVSWMTPIFKIGYRRQLQESDMYEMLPERRASVLGPQLREYWDNERRHAAAAGRPPSLLHNIAKLVPFIVLWIIVYLEESQSKTESPPPVWHGYALAVLLLISSIAITLFAQYWIIASNRTGTLVRTALVDMIFRKTTTMSSKARLDYPDGTIFNLMSTDPTRIDDALEGMMLLVAVPISCIITVGMLIYLMGPSALLGTFLLILVNPFQAWAMAALNPIRRKASRLTDTRIHVVTEVLQGIKSLPVFASALSFVLYAALGNELKPQIIFPALTLFTGLRVPLLVLPYCYGEALDAWVSTQRIERFLLAPDTEPLPPVDTTHKYALSIKQASFYWDQPPTTSPSPSTSFLSSDTAIEDSAQEQQPLLSDHSQVESDSDVVPFLKDITVDIPRGSLVAVVGPVGSGKSSLLQAMVGNMMKVRGDVIRGATISYASQTHWIQNATIRNNILFDTPYDEERYWRVVKACSLEKDLSTMPFGDQTEIGERGVNLSGGQKARLSLARSVYYNADTVVMDDPLSAVDSHVGKRLWEDCILKELDKKTRVIATHQLHVLPDVDFVIYMNHGRITEQGTFQSLVANENGDFHALMKQYGGRKDEQDEGQNVDGSIDKRKMVIKRRRSSAGKVQVTDVAAESDDEITTLTEADEEVEKPIAPQSQMVEEERAYGAISSKVYLSYIKLGGYWTWATIFFLISLQQAVGVAMSVWLSYWTGDKLHLPLWTYIEVYLGTGVIQLVIVLAGSIMMVVAIIKSSKLMHDKAFMKVLNAPMSFFDTTPMGRILNRLSKDITTLDSTLMHAINSFMITLSGIISVLALSTFFLPWMTPILVPLTVIYGFIAAYYQRSSREIKRVDALLRSHAYSYFSETLTGMGTLKAYHRHGVDKAISRNQHNIDRSNKAHYLLVLGTRWISIRAFLVGYILNFVAVILIVRSRFSISPATAGLVLSYLARLSSEMNWAIQCFNQVENNMNSAERLLHYANNLEQEPPAEIPDRKPEPSWPSQGQVSFRDVSMRYRDGLPLVLNNISFDIQAGHMVGVVGRTGAGKSSLIQALFRLVELESGSIIIDDIQTNTIGTVDLRSKISIIPQDPILFQGTVRYNLDPLSRHTEQEIWQVLETSGIKDYVQQEGGLDSLIAANGENLSVGQRQLVCLSRALLAKSKIVVLDEATASVDLATDSLIQKAIRVDFTGATVITIAHRLNTVVDYHRVLVMDQGQVAEYDTPRKLLRDHNSAFSKMVDETGADNATLLRSLAGC
ncbi:hypothetical protein BGX27_007755 [Mortierella sp. AM989]|nr:hypothetical protein BGX27_007755 [Mortierella sp. AM989]